MMFIKRVYVYMFLLASSLRLVSGQEVTKNLKAGSQLVIELNTPPPSGSSILWKIDLNKVIEYDKDFPKQGITPYGKFKGRATLNRTTGELKVTSLTKADNGVYSVEYDSKKQLKTLRVSVFKTVPKPNITFTFNEDHTSCTLTCVGDTTDAGEVAYSWKKDEQNLTDSQKTLQITSEEPAEYTCQLSNLVSEEESEPLNNPLHHGGPNIWLLLGLLLVGLLLVIGLICSILCAPACKPVREKIPFLPARFKATDPTPTPARYTPVATDSVGPVGSGAGNGEADNVTTNTNNGNVIEVAMAPLSGAAGEAPLNTATTPDLRGNTEERQDNAPGPANVTTVYGVVEGNTEGDGATTNTNNSNMPVVARAQPSSDEVTLNTSTTPDLHGNTEDRQDNGSTDTPTESTPLVGLPHEDVSNNTNNKGTGGETPINSDPKDTKTADDAVAEIKSSTSEVSPTAGNGGKGEAGSVEGVDSNAPVDPSNRMENSQSYAPKEDRPANEQKDPLKKRDDEEKQDSAKEEGQTDTF